jgi:hypothetical protein
MRATLTTIGAVAALALAPAAAGATSPPSATPPTPATPPAEAGCGAAGATVLANAAGSVAERIYASEVASSEVTSDKEQIESYAPLLSAVESGDRAAIDTAVHSLVYSHTHIVRLRVSRDGELLDDEGGPYILAPVTGTLRSHGRTIGSFAFSVQDDLGYVKLETRFLGAPVILRTEAGQVPIEGLLSPGPASIPDLGPVSYHGASYEAYSFNATAYPSGRVRVSLLLPLTSALRTQTCERIKTDELALVAQRISRRFQLSPSAYPPYVRLVNTMTHARVYVRAGSHTLAGTTRSTPPKLPLSGALRWHGIAYEVSSFQAPSSSGAVRVYVLVSH